VITLAIDTSEARGSVAVLCDGVTVARRTHDDGTDYSAWLLPAVEQALGEAGARMELVDLLGVSTGPGSFTGLRVGLTTVKAWAEVHVKPIVGVSRLEAMARSEGPQTGLVASCYDAQRGQVFGGLYRNSGNAAKRVGEELVISPEEFVKLVDGHAGSEPITWISLDPEMIGKAETLQERIARGDKVIVCSSELASTIGVLAEENAAKGEFSDPVALDANYVRRSDAEIFWKGSSAGVR
jgi:tRNA threonylcarbamoyladenosine biosynthesis protein TsaB